MHCGLHEFQKIRETVKSEIHLYCPKERPHFTNMNSLQILIYFDYKTMLMS